MVGCLSWEHVKTVCRLGAGGKTCRYLGINYEGWVCLKHTPAAGYIDRRVDQGTFWATGDRCDGICPGCGEALSRSKGE